MALPAPALLPWADFLPALEQWTRRTEALLRGDLDTADGPAEPAALPVSPAGALPPALAPRARAALGELARVEALGASRRGALQRARAYAAA